MPAHLHAGRVFEATAHVWAQEVFIFARRLRGNFNQTPLAREIFAEIGDEIQLGAHSIAGRGVRFGSSTPPSLSLRLRSE